MSYETRFPVGPLHGEDEEFECPEGLEEEECRDALAAVDVSTEMMNAGCDEGDLEEVLDMLFSLLDEGGGEFEYTCSNGARIRVSAGPDGVSVEVEERGYTGSLL